jgi:nicotinate-nucleotide adenylyltransferase
MSGRRRTGIIGGTFDPVHLGHLAAARAAADALALDEVLFVPSNQPPHRPARPRASAYHRFAMVALAVGPIPGFAADDDELKRPGPSFTADTLRVMSAKPRPASQLFFIIGTDAFAEIATWHDYPQVLDLAHFVVISRPGQSLDTVRARVPDLAPRLREARPGDVVEPGHPGVFLVQARTPDVSSTGIRERAERGASLVGLVPTEVERHIRRHRLYAADSRPSADAAHK